MRCSPLHRSTASVYACRELTGHVGGARVAQARAASSSGGPPVAGSGSALSGPLRTPQLPDARAETHAEARRTVLGSCAVARNSKRGPGARALVRAAGIRLQRSPEPHRASTVHGPVLREYEAYRPEQ